MTARLAATFILAAFALSACETVKGAGRDLEKAGQTITSEARAVQSQL